MIKELLTTGQVNKKQTTRFVVLVSTIGLLMLIGTPLNPVAGAETEVGLHNQDNLNIDYTPTNGSVSFSTPEKNITKQSPISFEMKATNFTIEPAQNGVSGGAGHFHILVDKKPLSPGVVIPNNESNGYYHYGGGQTTADIELTPGEHTIRLQAGDANHKAYNLTDSININVEESAATVESTFTINNVGANAWEVSSTSDYVETSAGNNPTITLETGVRYTITNDGWNTHPLAFRNESGTRLLSQESNDIGIRENNASINWSDSGNTVSFTLTEELADEINSYICTVHLSMQGTIEITQTPDVTGDGSAAQDIDGDNLYEDVNGDGDFDVTDVEVLFQNYESDVVQNNIASFDYNGDGAVDIIDVAFLFNDV